MIKALMLALILVSILVSGACLADSDPRLTQGVTGVSADFSEAKPRCAICEAMAQSPQFSLAAHTAALPGQNPKEPQGSSTGSQPSGPTSH